MAKIKHRLSLEITDGGVAVVTPVGKFPGVVHATFRNHTLCRQVARGLLWKGDIELISCARCGAEVVAKHLKRVA